MKKIDIGIIGCGDVAVIQYIPAIKNSVKLNLTAICDKDENRLKKVANFFGVKNVFTSHKEMISSGLIQAVANLTPSAFHYPINLDCINAMVHTYCEKPVSTDIEEIESLIKSIQNSKVKFACAPATPINPVIVKAKQLLKDGVIGKPTYAIGFCDHGGPASQKYIYYYKNLVKEQHLYDFEDSSTDPTWFYKPGGGALIDIGGYTLTTLAFLLGSAKYIQCLSGTKIPEVEIMGGVSRGKKIKVEIDDCTLMLIEFEEGIFASVSTSYGVKGTRIPDIEIYGTEGTISISDDYTKLEVYLENRYGLGAWNKTYEDFPVYWLAAGVEHLADCIFENREPVINARLAKHVTEIILKAPKSASSGIKTLIESKI